MLPCRKVIRKDRLGNLLYLQIERTYEVRRIPPLILHSEAKVRCEIRQGSPRRHGAGLPQDDRILPRERSVAYQGQSLLLPLGEQASGISIGAQVVWIVRDENQVEQLGDV